MEKCNCNGLNSDCFFCGGMGYFEPIEKQTFNIKAANSKNSKLNSKSKDEIQTKNPKKTKPSEIILNHINYSKQTFEKLRSFLKEKIKYEYALPNIKKNETKIKLYNQQISDIERIVFYLAG